MSQGEAAIMFADVSGSSRLFKSIGDNSARAIISKVVDMMMEITQLHSGVVIKTIGDEVMASFDTAVLALNAAVAIQNNITAKDYGAPLSIRIGFHFGPVLKEQGDVFGEAVNDAADLVKVAKGSQIVTSEASYLALPIERRSQMIAFDQIRLKGGSEKSTIYLVDWDVRSTSTATSFIPIAKPVNEPLGFSKMTLIYQDRTIVLTPSDMPYVIGRSLEGNLTVEFALASREHCTIDFRRGKFVLIDKSTNGTYVETSQKHKLYLRREEMVLEGSGVIAFSQETQVKGPHLLHYQC